MRRWKTKILAEPIKMSDEEIEKEEMRREDDARSREIFDPVGRVRQKQESNRPT